MSYSNDFVDTNKCEAIATTQIAHGAGVVFNVAGACGLGALAAAKQARVWGIGVDTDQSILGSFILTSVIKRYDVGFVKLLTAVASGNLAREARRPSWGCATAVRRSGRSVRRCPLRLLAGLDRVRRQILDGRLRVPVASAR